MWLTQQPLPAACTTLSRESLVAPLQSLDMAADPITPEEMANGLPTWLLYQATQWLLQQAP